MSSKLKLTLLAAVILLAYGVAVWGQAPPGSTTSSVNPAPGALWTYLGPTLGADWTTPPGVSNAAQPAHWFYAGPLSGANAVPTFRPMGNGDIPSGITIDSPIFTGNPTASTPAAGDNDNSIATTAFVRTAIAAAAGCTNVVLYGALGDDATDNTAAFNSAAAASKCISFPAGTFRFNSALTYTFNTANPQAMTIQGAGQDVTILHWPSAVGTALTLAKNQYSQNVHLRDFTMTTGQTADTAIRVTQSKVATAAIQSGWGMNDITRVILRSDEGYWEQGVLNITKVWNRGIWITNDSNWDFDGVGMFGQVAVGPPSARLGEGFFLDANNSTNIPVIFNFHRVNLNWLSAGIRTGSTIGHVEGININQSNFVGMNKAIWVTSGGNAIQVTIIGSQFGYCDSSILGEGVFNNLYVIGNQIYVPSPGLGMALYGPAVGVNIIGNEFIGQADPYGVSTNGIYLQPTSNDLVAPVIAGNTFTKLEAGINLAANTDGTMVYGNVFKNNGITNIQSLSASKYTAITGGYNVQTPQSIVVTGAVGNGGTPVLARLTLQNPPGTNDLKNGELVMVSGVGGITGIGTNGEVSITPIKVIDATHIDLLTVAFSGTYTNGGKVVSLPP